MSRFFDPENRENDARLHAPATERNRDVILEVLKTHLPRDGALLEVASGTGQHAAHFAPHFPGLDWQPTDLDPLHITSIDAWRGHAGADNLRAGVLLDVMERDWPTSHLNGPIMGLTAINLIHIAPFAVTESLIGGAARHVADGGVFFLYGPYKQNGKHTSESNEAFDASLKSRNPDWGVRDMEHVIEMATGAGFNTPDIIAMPANNLSLIFRK